jgi:hypothetical protein
VFRYLSFVFLFWKMVGVRMSLFSYCRFQVYWKVKVTGERWRFLWQCDGELRSKDKMSGLGDLETMLIRSCQLRTRKYSRWRNGRVHCGTCFLFGLLSKVLRFLVSIRKVFGFSAGWNSVLCMRFRLLIVFESASREREVRWISRLRGCS